MSDVTGTLASLQRKCGKFVYIRGLSHVGRLIWLDFASSSAGLPDTRERRRWARGMLFVLGQPCMRWCFHGMLIPEELGKFYCIHQFGKNILQQGLIEDKTHGDKPPSRVLYVRISALNKCHPNEVIHLHQVVVFDREGKNWALATNGARAKQASVHSTVERNGAQFLIDGNFKTCNHTAHGAPSNSICEITLASPVAVHQVVVHNVKWDERWHSSERLDGSIIKLLDDRQSVMLSHTFSKRTEPELFHSADSKYCGPGDCIPEHICS